MSKSVKTRFLSDIAKHEMTVLLDQGVYRHVRFQSPSDNCYWFELVTWPWHLSIGGDMGCYVFTRTEDMFKFFRRDDLAINEGYWSEKLVSTDRRGVKEFRHEAVRQWFRGNLRDCVKGWDKDARREIIEQVRELFADIDDKSEEEIRREIDGIMVHPAKSIPRVGASDHAWRAYCESRGPSQVFCDMWEIDFTEYKHHFLWCLHAIVWGIQQYDKAAVTT